MPRYDQYLRYNEIRFASISRNSFVTKFLWERYRRGALSGHSNMVGRSLYIGTVRVGEHKFTMSSLNFSLIKSEKFSNSYSWNWLNPTLTCAFHATSFISCGHQLFSPACLHQLSSSYAFISCLHHMPSSAVFIICLRQLFSSGVGKSCLHQKF